MHTPLIVYLTGPMAGLTVAECREWRLLARDQLEAVGFSVLDPTRELLTLPSDHIVSADADEKRFVFHRDKFDATRADILLVNFIGAKIVSLGSTMEMAWAHLAQKFIVTAMRDVPNPHSHTFIKEASSIIVPEVEEGVQYIITTFG